MIKEVSELSREEMLRLLCLTKGVGIGDYGNQDGVLLSLKEKGFINSIEIGYSFTEEGKKATHEFVDKYSKIIKDMVEQYGESVKTQLKIEEATGLPGLIIEQLARDQGITFLP